MKSFLDRLEPGPVQEWYRTHTHPIIVDGLSESLEGKGYELDPQSGLFRRPLYGLALPSTLIDIAFLRPTDFHFHRDVDEYIRVLNGKGALMSDLGSQRDIEGLSSGFQGVLHRRQAHSFRPNKDTYLELRIFCDGILNLANEVSLISFDKISEWIEYFSQAA